MLRDLQQFFVQLTLRVVHRMVDEFDAIFAGVKLVAVVIPTLQAVTIKIVKSLLAFSLLVQV